MGVAAPAVSPGDAPDAAREICASNGAHLDYRPVAGGGSFITFPALLFVGVPPVSANATNTFASCSGYLSGAYAFRHDLRAHRHELPRFLILSLLGGIGRFIAKGDRVQGEAQHLVAGQAPLPRRPVEERADFEDRGGGEKHQSEYGRIHQVLHLDLSEGPPLRLDLVSGAIDRSRSIADRAGARCQSSVNGTAPVSEQFPRTAMK